MEYTTVDRVLAKFHRDLKGTDLNESDAIEWIGEALDQMKLAQVQEEAVAFLEVKDYHADLPKGFSMITQIARNNNVKENECPEDKLEDLTTEVVGCYTDCSTHPANKAGYPVPLDCNGVPITDYDVAYYRPYFDLKWEYEGWTNHNYYKQNYTPVRLSNHSFFNSVVCKEKDRGLYDSCEDEYTIVGTVDRKLRFSFKNGSIALSYLKNPLDEETGYPLVPDNISYITAITYYLKWKIAEWYSWNGRQGFDREASKAEERWIKYCRQGKNFMKMPKGVDQHQNMLESSHYLIPRHKRAYGFFGNLGRSENRNFNDPDYRNRYYR